MSGSELPRLSIAVVGHTNAGKTSLLRTLLRDVDFGDVSSSPGTTQAVAGCALLVDGREVVSLYDTPGLEDSIGLLDAIECSRADHRADGLQLLEQFLQSSAADEEFAQEAKAIRQILQCDAALYVVDAREPVLGKNRDELRILAHCARPVVPVLNFVANEHARTNEWRDQLARVNMHAVAEFDTVALETNGEIHLFEKVQTLLDAYRPTIRALIESRKTEREELIRASAHTIADTLIDIAALAMTVQVADQDQSSGAMEHLKDSVRSAEQRAVRQLLELHRFRESDFSARALPIDDGQWGIDLFSPEAMQEYGVRGGAGAAAGAMVGLTLDIMLGGLSLGTGTAIGAAIGAALGAGRLPGAQLLDKVRGRIRLRVDEATLGLVIARQTDLVHALLHRGHADREPMNLRGGTITEAIRSEIAGILKQLRLASARPAWSHVSPDDGEPKQQVATDRRERLATRLADSITTLINHIDRHND